MATGNISFSEYQANKVAQGNPWTKDNPTAADQFQMIIGQNLRDGQSQGDAELNAVQEMQQYKAEGINPMGPINGREAGYNESQGAQIQRDAQEQQNNQALVEEQNAANTINDFNQWRMQQGQAPMGIPPATSTGGWQDAADSLEGIRNLEVPRFKR